MTRYVSGGESELGKHHEVAAVGLGPLEKLDEPLDDLRTAVGPLNGSELRRPDGDDPRDAFSP